MHNSIGFNKKMVVMRSDSYLREKERKRRRAKIGKERNIIVNSDKISTFELLKKHSDEFLSSVKSSDSENGIATNLTFNYKDLSQNNQAEDQSQKGRMSVEGKNNTVLNGVAEHRMSLIFMPFDIDKNVDVWV